MDPEYSGLGRKLLIVVGLSFLSCTLFVLVRFSLTHKFAQSYLVWNLLLAAVPVIVSWLAGGQARRLRGMGVSPLRQKLAGGCFFILWLVFYPNAPYIFTDFIHVVRRAGLGQVAANWLSEYDLLWFDIVMNSAFAFVGHFLGLVSMNIMHGTMLSLFGRVAGWLLLVPAIVLSGFGIHLGRFSRFNSWDMALYPVDSFRVMFRSMFDPAALLFSMAFSLFIAMTYVMFYVVNGVERRTPGR
ncbi:MAG: DUF1361 domain-containing protein [Spirochaetales bacterium]|nr:DUF1361 domain-containing protein [Spirochaetales bacterium]